MFYFFGCKGDKTLVSTEKEFSVVIERGFRDKKIVLKAIYGCVDAEGIQIGVGVEGEFDEPFVGSQPGLPSLFFDAAHHVAQDVVRRIFLDEGIRFFVVQEQTAVFGACPKTVELVDMKAEYAVGRNVLFLETIIFAGDVLHRGEISRQSD